ncbi:hypothetical protein HHK36_018297 [Tetracentron sinense]|uniref:Uncharacterized protein n=1 Tax=Tetracentron sinense TaxID=13715 RepID=A0A834YYG8_TETSI|nr:hypothetical protein HHK36_018297 [Tetracentron sinense]
MGAELVSALVVDCTRCLSWDEVFWRITIGVVASWPCDSPVIGTLGGLLFYTRVAFGWKISVEFSGLKKLV